MQVNQRWQHSESVFISLNNRVGWLPFTMISTIRPFQMNQPGKQLECDMAKHMFLINDTSFEPAGTVYVYKARLSNPSSIFACLKLYMGLGQGSSHCCWQCKPQIIKNRTSTSCWPPMASGTNSTARIPPRSYLRYMTRIRQ